MPDIFLQIIGVMELTNFEKFEFCFKFFGETSITIE